MKERPILFSGPMVRAIFTGSKTQTRRMINRLKGFGQITEFQVAETHGYHWTFRDKRGLWNEIRHDRLMECCPYGKPGDRLWVRETWNAVRISDDDEPHYSRDIPAHPGGFWRAIYAADLGMENHRWRPSIHMPRWASRITLEIVSVRVERLQDISESDAASEGVEFSSDRIGNWCGDGKTWRLTAREAFRDLWESIHGPGSWDANPWVWVIEFKRVEITKGNEK